MAKLSRLQQFFPNQDEWPKYRYLFFDAKRGSGTTFAAGAGTGDPAVGEVGSVAGIRFEASTDDHAWLLHLPDDVDVEQDIDIQVIWSSDQTSTADSYTWTLKYTELTLDSSAVAVGATALDTPIAADTNVGTANAIQATAWGTISGGTLSGTLGDGYLLAMLLDPASLGGTISADVVIVWGLRVRYMPRRV